MDNPSVLGDLVRPGYLLEGSTHHAVGGNHSSIGGSGAADA